MKTDFFLQVGLEKINAEIKKHLTNQETIPIHFTYDHIDLLELINHVCCEKIFFFKSKYQDFNFLGLGHSQTIKAVDLPDFLLKNPSHYLIAAFLFEENPELHEFILPEWVFISQNGKTEILINPSFDYQIYSSANSFFTLHFDLFHYDPSITQWESYEEYPEHDQWTKMIHKCNELFDNGYLEKIVLSRKKIFAYKEDIGTIAFFKAMMKKNNNAESSYAIFHQTSSNKAFLSLSPEKLFSIQNDNFESISLAGSAPRGDNPSEDQIFEDLLKTNDKIIREHQIVTEEIIKRIKPLSKKIEISNLQTMKLSYIQHRSTPISATLLSNVNALHLINTLHPTPAVGGLPWDKAKAEILELEPYDREFYAAPIGIISKNYSEIAVGIRSAYIEGEKVTLFGGAGIVSGSVAEEEWSETGIKMKPFLKVVNP